MTYPPHLVSMLNIVWACSTHGGEKLEQNFIKYEKCFDQLSDYQFSRTAHAASCQHLDSLNKLHILTIMLTSQIKCYNMSNILLFLCCDALIDQRPMCASLSFDNNLSSLHEGYARSKRLFNEHNRRVAACNPVKGHNVASQASPAGNKFSFFL